MTGPGAGPSRRSHTKSRKGCKTCKRRHIRCDETFPQCRNCTKHQVRCDYVENLSPGSERRQSSEQPSVILTPGSEQRVDTWQHTGNFPYPDLHVFPPPATQDYSRNELRLMNHISSISNDLMNKGTTNLTIWTQQIPRLLSVAASHQYVMHALLSFSANNLTWEQGSDETRNLHIQHGSIALRGLHEAISNFSQANVDAVLGASLLMSWQATDWRSWSSLAAGIRAIITTMRSWSYESTFAGSTTQDSAFALLRDMPRPFISAAERTTILQSIATALQRLQAAMTGHEMELQWATQLAIYVRRLQSLPPAPTGEEQFAQVYILRKWLFWVPVALLKQHGGQGPAMLTIAYLYATALAIAPLFPDIGPGFCAALVFPPLQAIVSLTDAMQSQQAMEATTVEIAMLMEFPRRLVSSYQVRMAQMKHGVAQQEAHLAGISTDTFSHNAIANISPIFAPLPLDHQLTSQSASTPSSVFLEVPGTLQSGFSYGVAGWGRMPSPGFPPQNQPYLTPDDQTFDYITLEGDFGGGFVAPASIWA